MTPAAKLSFAADFFMLQAILRSAGIASGWPYEPVAPLQYVFPRNCFRQVIDELLYFGWQQEIGMEPFQGHKVRHHVNETWLTFPNEVEEERMHSFFEWFNLAKRLPAQGIDPTYPPLPDFYQGGSAPLEEVINRYQVQIVEAFEEESLAVHVPIGPNYKEFPFRL